MILENLENTSVKTHFMINLKVILLHYIYLVTNYYYALYTSFYTYYLHLFYTHRLFSFFHPEKNTLILKFFYSIITLYKKYNTT